MRSHHIALRAAAALTLALAGCSGGSGVPSNPISAPTAAAAAPAGKALLTLRFDIPRSAASSATRRSPQYLSYATQSVVISVQQGTGTPTTTVVNTGSTSAACSEAIGQSTLVCTTGLYAPIGSDTINVTAYDQPQGPNTKAPPFTGNVLSSITNFPATVAAGTASNVVVTLSGSPVSAKVTLTPPQVPAGTAATSNVHVFAFDADGYLIMGNYLAPLTLANSDASGVTTLSTTSVNASGAPVTLAYNGGALPNGASITATAGSAASPAALFSVLTGTHDFMYYGINGGNLNAVQIYDLLNTSPVAGQPANVRTVQPNAFFGRSAVFALGPHNETTFATGDFFGPQTIPVPAPMTETGPTVPTAMLAWTPPNMTIFAGDDISPDGHIFQSYDVNSGTPGGANTGLIGVWAEGSSGNVPPAYSFTTTAQPGAIRFDGQGNLWTIDAAGIEEYAAASLAAAGQNHPISPVTTIASTMPTPVGANSIRFAFALAFDVQGNIYALSFGSSGGLTNPNQTEIYGFSTSDRGKTVPETSAQEQFAYNFAPEDMDIDTNPASPTYDSIGLSLAAATPKVLFFQTLSQQPPTLGSTAVPFYTINLNTDGNATGSTASLRFGH